MPKAPVKYAVICVRWTERDSWSGPEDNGYSLHLTVEDAQKYIKEIYGDRSGPTPECYDLASQPYTVGVNKRTYNQVQKNKNVRMYGDAPKV